jgi:excisionase family DNA binding protein
MVEKPFFTLKETAEYLGISYRNIRRLVKKGVLPAFRVGRQWRVKLQDLERYVKQGLSRYGLVAVKPLFFYPDVLDRYRSDSIKYYLHDEAFHGRFGVKEEWYQKITLGKSAESLPFKLAEVHYQKVRLRTGAQAICIEENEFRNSIGRTEESEYWAKYRIHRPELD